MNPGHATVNVSRNEVNSPRTTVVKTPILAEQSKRFTIWKFSITSSPSLNVLDLPEDAEILHVGLQDDILRCWVKFDPEALKQQRTLEVLLTGDYHQESPKFTRKHLATLQRNHSVYHIFERVPVK